ncbi:MAG: hypothetical protein ACR2J9_12205 [Gaiellales bacterium]
MTPAIGTSRLHAIARRLLLCVGVCTIVLTGAAGSASAVMPSDCQFPQTWGVCGVVTNRVWAFGSTGGMLQTTNVWQTGESTSSGNWVGRSWSAFGWNESSWNSWSAASNSSTNGGDVSYIASGTLGASPVKVQTQFGNLSGATDPKFTLNCPSATYLVCVLPKVWERKINANPTQFTGLATLESRPLIIKILNLTDQPLVRSSEARGTGVLRDTGVSIRPATVPAVTDELAGTGYYHYFRDASVANNVTMSYAFADGATSTVLTGGVLDINVDVAADGTTGASACTPPEGLSLTVECKVTMLGTADGVLTALVSVGV